MKKLAVAALIAATVVVTPATAGAKTTTTTVTHSSVTTSATKGADRLATLKAKSDTAIKDRVAKLDDLKNEINASKYISADHKSGLLAEIAASQAGLNALGTKIQADTDTATVLADAKLIVSDYRVYVLEVPKVHEILAVDTMTSINAKFQAASPKLSSALSAAQAKGTDVSAAQTALADLNTKTDAIDKVNSALPGPVLSLQPSGYPANRATITSTRQALATMTAQAKAAKADVMTISNVLH